MSPFSPWAQQPTMAPGAEEKAPPKGEKSWWERNLGAGAWKGFAETMIPGVTKPGYFDVTNLGALSSPQSWLQGAQGAFNVTGAALPFMFPGAMAAGLTSAAKGVPAWMGRHKLATGLGALGGYLGLSNMEGPTPAPSVSGPMGLEDVTGAALAGFAPSGPTAPTAPTLPQPGEGVGGMGPGEEPQIVEIGGQKFWWNPTGGIYGTGGWDTLPTQAEQVPRLSIEQQIEQARLDREAAQKRTQISAGLTPEQEIAQAEAQRTYQATQSQAEQDAQMRRLQEQYGYEQQMAQEQAEYSRQQQAAAAAQRMTQMYAADPYKYWAQMGQGTPEAVARLTGGEAGGQISPGTPFSMPSAQWWGNLLPSEQQQIAGGLNWMGVDPQDWYSMYQRMIPGLGSRQTTPQWAR